MILLILALGGLAGREPGKGCEAFRGFVRPEKSYHQANRIPYCSEATTAISTSSC
jgi:hypothetical protein